MLQRLKYLLSSSSEKFAELWPGLIHPYDKQLLLPAGVCFPKRLGSQPSDVGSGLWSTEDLRAHTGPQGHVQHFSHNPTQVRK